MEFLAVIVLLGAGIVIGRLIERRADPAPSLAAVALPAEPIERAKERARHLRDAIGWPTPWELDASDAFREAAEELASSDASPDALVALSADDDETVRCVALEAIARRPQLPPGWPQTALERLPRSAGADERFFLHTLVRAPGELIGPVLAEFDHLQPGELMLFLRARVEHEPPSVATFSGHVPLRLVEPLTQLIDSTAVPELRAAFEAWHGALVDPDFLQGFAQIWRPPHDRLPAALVGPREPVVEQIQEALADGRSVVLVGEAGVGKSVLLRAALDRVEGLQVVFEAGAAAVNAGASYVGQLEGRVRDIATRLRGRRAVWVFPRIDEALWAGQHARSPQGMLDALLPHVDAGDVLLAADASPAGWDRLVKERPRVAAAFVPIRVRPLGVQDSIDVAGHALAAGDLGVSASDEVLGEASELAAQFMPGSAAPGALVRLVREAAKNVAERGGDRLQSADLLDVLAETSGLPMAMLDAAAALDLAEVRAFFDRRILGQPEAIEALVERIAMIKAGVTDPTRPLGVFMFVGPTGTGKTEVAKALAEYVFGASSRLVRLDMSEFQTPDSLERLLADPSDEPRAAPLIGAVRKDPFAVVLLDEFEKAATHVWDVFLQVFDDGRLTDLRGRVVDFRRCVIILTSNVGSSLSSGGGLGFEPRRHTFSAQSVERELARAFRPELLNRIDRVIVFRPFEREQVRLLLEKELDDILERRGLRARPWAIEYDDSALALLMDRGFSPELGARPLKRAVERYLLAPLARVIVEQTAPSGDQFLFVSAAGDRIDVRFVDPDAEVEAERDADEPAGEEVDVRRLALSPRADARSVAELMRELGDIRAVVEGEEFAQSKAEALAMLGSAGFWEDPGRFAVLAEAEYRDRLEAALRTAVKLGGRLERAGGAQVAGLLALRLHVLRCALTALDEGGADQVFLELRPAAGEVGAAFAEELAGMYLGWAERRGMQALRLDRVLLLGGLGAVPILSPEEGLHVLEADDEHDRVTVAVTLAVRPPETALDTDLGVLATRLLAARAPRREIVRRYRQGEAALVRDAARGYRTGRLDRVLAGDFDLF
jgi:ATP-dependent Clp protease ATP-binding subunit ClpC